MFINSLYFCSFQDEQKSENKRSLLPVVNINTGKREDRFEELKTRELQDLESESESEDEGIPTEEKDLTIEEIKKLQNEQLSQWSNRLVQVVFNLRRTPTDGENFLARSVCTFTNFSENVLEYRNRQKICQRF